jgi:hypothetical protein
MCWQETNKCVDSLPPLPNDNLKKQKINYLHRPNALGSQLESKMETHTITYTSTTRLLAIT